MIRLEQANDALVLSYLVGKIDPVFADWPIFRGELTKSAAGR